MPLPFALDPINLWLLRDFEHGPEGRREGWAFVDCGIDGHAAELLDLMFKRQLDLHQTRV